MVPVWIIVTEVLSNSSKWLYIFHVRPLGLIQKHFQAPAGFCGVFFLPLEEDVKRTNKSK